MRESTRRIWAIARREYVSTVRRKEFLLVTFGLPLFYALLIGGVGLATVAATVSAEKAQAPPVVGYLDQSGKLPVDVLLGKVAMAGDAHTNGILYPTVKAGQKAVENKTVRVFVVLPPDFAKTGKLTEYKSSGSLFSSSRGDSGLYTNTLQTALLVAGGATRQTINRALSPFKEKTFAFNKKTGLYEIPDPLREASRFFVPYAASLLLLMSIFISSSYLLYSIAEEKENRVIEVLLSAVTHEELLAGKIVGLGGAGLTQIAIWLGSSGLLMLIGIRVTPAVAAFSLSPATVAVGLLMFVLGFLFYATAMAGLGSLGTSWRESQQMSGVAVTFAIIPFLCIAPILEVPDGWLARSLSFFPPTAPITMMLRVAADGVSFWEVLLSSVLLAFSIWGVLRLSARLFRLSLLMYGQKPTFAEVWRWLMARPATGH